MSKDNIHTHSSQHITVLFSLVP